MTRSSRVLLFSLAADLPPRPLRLPLFFSSLSYEGWDACFFRVHKFDFFNVVVRFDKSLLSFSKFKIFPPFIFPFLSLSPKLGLMRTDEKFNDNIRFRP
jgi:hypothetical protein